eukprot:2993494-Pyramimonas_sp.AAC.1
MSKLARRCGAFPGAARKRRPEEIHSPPGLQEQAARTVWAWMPEVSGGPRRPESAPRQPKGNPKIAPREPKPVSKQNGRGCPNCPGAARYFENFKVPPQAQPKANRKPSEASRF